MSEKSKNTVFTVVFVLLLSNILVKVIGLFFKIPIQRLIGDSGMGYFNVAYNIYSWLYMISTAGLPVAISVLISESTAKKNAKDARTIFRVAVSIFAVIGIIGMFLMFIMSKTIERIVSMDGAYICIMAIAPTLFFICISSAVRGYFQGFQNMVPTAVSQIIEALCKMVLGLLLASYAISNGYKLYVVAAFAISGVTIGSCFSMLYSVIAKLVLKPDKEIEDIGTPQREKNDIFKNLIKIAIPITISSSLMSFTSVVDAVFVTRQLQAAGYSEEVAIELYGNYSTLAVPFFNMPLVLIYPIAYSIVPLISAAFALKNSDRIKNIVNSSLKITTIIAFPCAMGLSSLAESILKLMFNDKSASLAAPMLSILSISVLFCSLIAISSSVLQSVQMEKLPIISMFCGAAVKILSSYFLIGNRNIGRFGIPLSTCLCYLVITVLNVYFVLKNVKMIPDIINIFIKPFASSVLACTVAILVNRQLIKSIGNSVSVLFSIACAAILYVIVLFVIKTIKKEDIMILPKSEKIYGILKKIKLIK